MTTIVGKSLPSSFRTNFFSANLRTSGCKSAASSSKATELHGCRFWPDISESSVLLSDTLFGILLGCGVAKGNCQVIRRGPSNIGCPTYWPHTTRLPLVGCISDKLYFSLRIIRQGPMEEWHNAPDH